MDLAAGLQYFGAGSSLAASPTHPQVHGGSLAPTTPQEEAEAFSSLSSTAGLRFHAAITPRSMGSDS